MNLTRDQAIELNKILDKWRPIVGVRGALFGFKGKKQVLQVQFGASFLEKADPELIATGFPEFHRELADFLKVFNSDVEYIKIEPFDIAENEFWLLAQMGYDERSKQKRA